MKQKLVVILLLATIFLAAFSTMVSAGPISDWNVTFEGGSSEQINTVYMTSDMGYLLCGKVHDGSSTQAWIIKTDSQGTELWNQTYGDSGTDECQDVIQVDGEYYFAGTYHNGADTDGWLVQINATDGSMIWNVTYDYGNSEILNSLMMTTANGFILAGRNDTGGNPYALLIETNGTGDVIWATGNAGPAYTGANAVIEDSDGNFAVAGYRWLGSGYNFSVMKYDGSGNYLWSQEYFQNPGDAYNNIAYDIIESSNGNYTIVGKARPDGAYRAVMININKSGNRLWNYTYGSAAAGHSVDATNDGYIIGGTSGTDNGILIKTNSTGAMEWSYLAGGVTGDQFYSVEETSPNNYIAAGKRSATAWLLKVTENYSSNLTGFVSSWDTTLTSTGSSNSNQIKLPLYSAGTYNFTVDWGDGNSDNITTGNQAEVTHTYAVAGNYTINITGEIVGFRFNDDGDRLKLIDISQWGNLRVGNYGDYFYGCENLNSTATDALNLTGTTDLNNMFRRTTNFNGDITNWDVSQVIEMDYMFVDARAFNQPIGVWDVSNVTEMDYMFMNAFRFNQSLNSWNVSKVTNMNSMFRSATDFNEDITGWEVVSLTTARDMFYHATNFNQDISGWDVSSLVYAAGFFYDAENFNQDISSWNTSKINDMNTMFRDATNFNQDISGWDTSEVTNMASMFQNADNFNQNISGWDTSKVMGMGSMFSNTDNFNQDISSWNISSVTSMPSMFSNAVNFNQTLASWNTSKVRFTGNMFYGAVDFNQDLSSWDTSAFEDTSAMFRGATSFNQDLSSWDTSQVTEMDNMFYDATSFNQNLSSWNTSSVDDMQYMFTGATIFNGNISSWDTSQVTSMQHMFNGATNFNQDIGNWNTSSLGILGIRLMFRDAVNFDQNISSWDVSNVQYFNQIFDGATSFNKSLNSWNVSNAIQMSGMFRDATNFNQDISSWDTSSVTRMPLMFDSATSFDQDLGGWNVSSVTDMDDMFVNVKLSATNYDSLLIGWDNLVLQNGITFDASNSQYCIGETARSNIMANYGWTINDDGKNCTGIGGINLSVNKTALQSSYNYTDMVEFKFVLKNTGTTVLSDINLSDSFNSNWLTYNGSSCTNFTDSNMTEGWFDLNITECMGGSFSPMQQYTFYVNFTATNPGYDYNTTNNVSVNASDILNSSVFSDNATVEIIGVPFITNVNVTKTALLSSYNNTEIVQFRIEVENTGSLIPLTYINLSDSFNSDWLTYNGSSCTNFSAFNFTEGWFDLNITACFAGALQQNQKYLLFVNFTAVDRGYDYSITNDITVNATGSTNITVVDNATGTVQINSTTPDVVDPTLTNPRTNVTTKVQSGHMVNIQADASDNYSGLANVTVNNVNMININGTLWELNTTSAVISCAEPLCVLNFSASDNAGNVVNASINYTIDDTAPVNTSAFISTRTSSSIRVSSTFNESVMCTVSYGNSTGNLSNNVTSAAFSATGSVSITGLSASTTYFYSIVSCVDQANNVNAIRSSTFNTTTKRRTTGGGGSGGGGGGGSFYTRTTHLGELATKGITFITKRGQTSTFDYKDTLHSVSLQSFTINEVQVLFSSINAYFTLKIGDVAYIDFDGNGKPDAFITVHYVKGGLVELFMKAVPETTPVKPPTQLITPQLQEDPPVKKTVPESQTLSTSAPPPKKEGLGAITGEFTGPNKGIMDYLMPIILGLVAMVLIVVAVYVTYKRRD